MPQEPNTYSIQIRLSRITLEDAYVSVPVTDAITLEKEDGTLGIDFEKLKREAVKWGMDPRVEWQVENLTIDLHATQGARPAERNSFDPTAY